MMSIFELHTNVLLATGNEAASQGNYINLMNVVMNVQPAGAVPPGAVPPGVGGQFRLQRQDETVSFMYICKAWDADAHTARFQII